MIDFTVLYAEDDLAHLALARNMFVNAGYNCPIRHFHNGKELLDHLNNVVEKEGLEALDNTILLIDLKMPVMSGIETLKSLKSDDQLKDLPVIIFTTSSNSADIRECQALGCDGYFEKTFNFVQANKLWNIINELIENMSDHSFTETKDPVVDVVAQPVADNIPQKLRKRAVNLERPGSAKDSK